MGKVSFFCMCFLAATTLLNATSVERCEELQKALSRITQHANITHPPSFHVPVDVKHNCLESALICFRTQVHKLQEATGRNSETISFERLLKKVKLTKLLDQKDCTPCLEYRTYKPSEFLEKMDALLQRMIFNYGKKPITIFP